LIGQGREEGVDGDGDGAVSDAADQADEEVLSTRCRSAVFGYKRGKMRFGSI